MAWKRGTPWPIDRIRKWIEEGKTHQWVADQLGTANQRISKLCAQHGIKVHRVGPRNGSEHPNWKGGRLISGSGYILVYCPEHPYAKRVHKSGGYVWEHRLIMEIKLGRYLHPSEVVHHKNKNKTDNRIENLVLFASNGDHLHQELKGQCPKWSKAGKKRISAAVKERWKEWRAVNAIHQR